MKKELPFPFLFNVIHTWMPICQSINLRHTYVQDEIYKTTRNFFSNIYNSVVTFTGLNLYLFFCYFFVIYIICVCLWWFGVFVLIILFQHITLSLCFKNTYVFVIYVLLCEDNIWALHRNTTDLLINKSHK